MGLDDGNKIGNFHVVSSIGFSGTVHTELTILADGIVIIIILTGKESVEDQNSANNEEENAKLKPLAVGILGKSENVIKIVFDITEMSEKDVLKWPIVVTCKSEQRLIIEYEPGGKKLELMK